MNKLYETESDIADLVDRFERGAIPRDEWGHHDHLVVGLWYIKNSSSLPEATNKMRAGLLHHLKSIGVDLTKEMPYHETITRFWMGMLANYVASKNGCSIAEMVAGLACEFSDKDLPLKYYSRELLFSDKARAEFVEPDLQKIL